ncbi:CDP-glycerol glycerophosphotransferase family protein [Isoptericola chiayiensis]|uniref:CDP-glycerol glycerophosphotransferase family protein n=1 Tax=Isoptericola chiayiensis TaxID=579446 RepID=A0ABP8Y662_9MICO|nr:CDP-glycerol glycerophosphotransferase family protein [Isoptericola chiayiensis]NOV99312.1 hypothetical protein [Isoptericola chiayiensis]
MPTVRTPARPVTRATSWAAGTLIRWGVHAKRLLVSAAERGAESSTDVSEHGSTPVVAYFGDQPATLYQIRQWLPVFEAVAQHRPLLVLTRDATTSRLLRQETSLPVVLAHRIDDVLAAYRQVDAKVVVYVNNGMLNFQSLIYPDALHVHVNHGESDKISMVSNQAKAYDRVVVAGRAAVERHRRALINLPDDRLAVCGRPQLDHDVDPVLPPAPAGVRTVLYAPTWSGENDANNYTSLDRYGEVIVRAVLSHPDLRLVYRPHPRVVEGTDPACARAHRTLVGMIESANRAAERHLMPFHDAPLAVFDGVDLLVTDVSSVGLDFLYLRPEAPIVLTDRRTDRERLECEAPVARGTDVVDATTVEDVAGTIRRNLDADPHRAERARLRDHYFGFERHESSTRFQELVEECITTRDALVRERDTR